MINGRQEPVSTDPDLSVIRMATVETIHNQAAPRRGSASSLAATGGGHFARTILLYATTLASLASIFSQRLIL